MVRSKFDESFLIENKLSERYVGYTVPIDAYDVFGGMPTEERVRYENKNIKEDSEKE